MTAIRSSFYMSYVLAALSLFMAFRPSLEARAADKEYKLTEIQKLRLQVKLDAAKEAQTQMQIAQSQFNQAINAFNDQVLATKKENNWPDTLKIDPQTLTFMEPPPEPKAPTEAPKAK